MILKLYPHTFTRYINNYSINGGFMPSNPPIGKDDRKITQCDLVYSQRRNRKVLNEAFYRKVARDIGHRLEGDVDRVLPTVRLDEDYFKEAVGEFGIEQITIANLFLYRCLGIKSTNNALAKLDAVISYRRPRKMLTRSYFAAMLPHYGWRLV